MAGPPETENAPADDRGASINIGSATKQIHGNDNAAGWRRQDLSAGEGLHAWARKRGARAADDFFRLGFDRSAESYFDDICRREALLCILRDVAEPAFNDRLAGLGGGL